MRTLGKYLLRGIAFFLPIFLTVYILYIFIVWSENWVALMVKPFAEHLYFPGVGLLLALAFLLFIGFCVSLPVFSKSLRLIELPFKNVPIVKSVYVAIKSLADYFSPDGDQSAQQVVMVRWPDTGVEIIGFVTRSEFEDLPMGFPAKDDDKVAVYIPLSYQVGGWTVFVSRSWVTKIDMPVEAAMRSALTAWMPEKN